MDKKQITRNKICFGLGTVFGNGAVFFPAGIREDLCPHFSQLSLYDVIVEIRQLADGVDAHAGEGIGGGFSHK